jgi:hypothetical protein
VNDLQTEIRATQSILADHQETLKVGSTVAQLKSCVKGASESCSTALASVATFLGLSKKLLSQLNLENAIVAAKEAKIAAIQASAARWEKLHGCEVAQVDSNATVKRELLALKDVEFEALKVDYQTRLALSEVEKLRNQATRIMAEQEETEQLQINLEAARNDPNVRIYKNDAILNADFTFYDALKDAYKATRVFEYYTSQSYAALDKLGLVRLVSRGDFNLENYLTELENAYDDFLEQSGRPDLRVQVLSLRDDILNIPRTDDTGRALSQSERVSKFREELRDQKWLDGHGYRVIPFSTSLESLSPVTRNHKIAYLEAEVIGSNVGDTLGRVYLSQSGTGLVHALDGDRSYYRFPERLAVMNPFFNGVRSFTPDVYRNDRLRDRPVVNTNWEFVLNQRDETVNEDVDLNSLTDIRLFVYYTDFTQLD